MENERWSTHFPSPSTPHLILTTASMDQPMIIRDSAKVMNQLNLLSARASKFAEDFKQDREDCTELDEQTDHVLNLINEMLDILYVSAEVELNTLVWMRTADCRRLYDLVFDYDEPRAPCFFAIRHLACDMLAFLFALQPHLMSSGEDPFDSSTFHFNLDEQINALSTCLEFWSSAVMDSAYSKRIKTLLEQLEDEDMSDVHAFHVYFPEAVSDFMDEADIECLDAKCAVTVLLCSMFYMRNVLEHLV